MKISHECPLDLLETSLTFNDYQYCLPRYYKKYSKYKEFFLKYRDKKDSFIILDNGLYEGDSFTNEDLLVIINELNPDIFILPDVWNDSYKTFNNAKYWIDNIFLPRNINLMIVVQGKTYSEIHELVWDSIKIGINHFGFNHVSIAYNKIYPHSDNIISKIMGRIITINKLIEEDIWDKFKDCYIHLLGINNPIELKLINKEFINSVDTSNPIIQGINNQRYSDFKLEPKPSEKIELFMEKDLASSIENIIFNIQSFRKLCI